ncbi:UNVERIFIED_CONTAM: hypothetical protein Sradi_2061100 [Sesamum radiatum]|uniref:Uncharacterized protein n=1 Tax=Sesamum radiatum TaxID=300843 RepID=A0AAW2TH42_SESRA
MASSIRVSPKGIAGCPIPGNRAPTKEQDGIPFTEGVMADELLVNCRTPTITEYNGTNLQEHLSRFENAALLHRYTDNIKYRVFITTFARAAQ